MKRIYKYMKKKGVSPIIATVLLIGLVIVIGILIFTWFKSMQQEAITKFDGQNIELVCNDVSFDASYSDGTLTISNFGNVPIYDFNVRTNYRGGHSTSNIANLGFDWPDGGLNQGAVKSSTLNLDGSTETIILTPILLGLDKDGNKKSAPCDEKRNGVEIPII